MTYADYIACQIRPGACMIEVTDGPEKSDGGIWFADKYRPMPGWGVVRKLADDCRDKGVEIGDSVVFKRWAGTHFETTDRRTLVLCDFDKHVEAVIGVH